MIVVPFRESHLDGFNVQPAQTAEFRAAGGQYGKGWTALVDGRAVACAGLLELWNGRFYAWALLSADCGPHMLRLTKEIKARLAAENPRRVEMVVAAGFEPGKRWAEMLGFRLESFCPAFLHDGGDALVYVRLAKWQQ